MIPLVEASLWQMGAETNNQSTIGNEYGDIYENMLETAKATKLNKHVVPPYYEKYIKPLTSGAVTPGTWKPKL